LRQLLSGYQKFYGALDEPVTWLWVLSPYFLFLLMRHLFNRMRPEGGTAIGKVAATGKVSLPESLVEAGGDINTANATGQTPLHLAAASGNVETVRMLLDEGAELDLPDTVEGFSALHVATMHGHADVVDLLVRYGADPEARTRRQQTPLHLAALHGHAGVTARLLKYHVRLDSLDAEGMTAHQLAEKYGRNDVAGLISDYAENIWPYLQISNG
jgi:ankyrin repeat protein